MQRTMIPKHVQGEHKKLYTSKKVYRKQMLRIQNFTPTPIDRKALGVLF
jgi:hypothetical protein